MRSFVLIFITAISILSCDSFESKSSFGNRSGTVEKASSPETLKIPKEDDIEIKDPIQTSKGKFFVEIDPANLDLIRGRKSDFPVAIYFALDVTGSMQSVITAIKENIKAFVDQLAAKKIDLRFGVVAFRDEIAGTFPLSNSIDGFKAFLDSQKAAGGADAFEAALLATDTAFQRISSEENRADTLKVVLTITDNVAHHGVPGTVRDCSITQTVNLLNSYPANQQKQMRLFHSTAQYGALACGMYNSPQKQFDDILSGVFSGNALKDRGGWVTWPFTSTTLLTELSGKIQENFPDLNSACLAKEARAFIGDKEIASWKADLDSTYKNFEASAAIKFEANAKPEDLGKDGKVSIIRCCVDVDKFKAGGSKECLHEKIQTAKFKLK